MAVHDQIERVRGNVVGVSSASNGVSDNLSSLSTRLSDELGGVRDQFGLSDAVSADSLIGDSLRCRLQELGGSIMDLIEDGFGLGDLIKDFKMPDLSELGAKLAQLNPMNLLDSLGDISLESITNKVGELINDAVGFIGDVIDKTFQSVERAMKGIGDMFDEFGDRVADLGGLVQDTISGIVGGVGQVLQDITQGIEDIVGSLLAPCPQPSTIPSVQAQQSLQADIEMFDTDIEMVHGNIVNVGAIADSTGKFSKIVTQQATRAAESTTSGSGISIPLAVDPKHAAPTTDAAAANAEENQQRNTLNTQTLDQAKDSTADAMVEQVESEKKQGDQEESKELLSTTDESGENIAQDSVFDLNTCSGILKKFDIQLQRITNLSNSVVESDKTFFNGAPTGAATRVRGFWANTSQGLESLLLAKTHDGTWHVALTRYPVRNALSVLKETGKWPVPFLNSNNQNYGVVEPKYLDNLKQSWEISQKILSQQNLDKLKNCIIEDEEKLKQNAIASLDRNSRNYQTDLNIEMVMTDRSNRVFYLRQVQSFHDKFVGETQTYKFGRSDGVIAENLAEIRINICSLIGADGSRLLQKLNGGSP